jgi:hypothetical protein
MFYFIYKFCLDEDFGRIVRTIAYIIKFMFLLVNVSVAADTKRGFSPFVLRERAP